MRFSKLFFLTALFFFFVTHEAFSKVKIENIGLQTKTDSGILTIAYHGNILEYPEMDIKDNRIIISIPNAKLAKNFNKKVSFASLNNDTEIKTSEVSGNSKVELLLPFNLGAKKDLVSMQLQGNRIELNLPKLKITSNKEPSKVTQTKKTVEVKKEVTKPKEEKKLDRNYLDALLALENKNEPQKEAVQKEEKKETLAGADVVKVEQSAPTKLSELNTKSSFSLMGYAGKFVAFLGVILLFFYGIVTLMKKGVIKKGKLGFLHNQDNVMVLSTTYIGPKKSLMLVRVHKQVFLVSSTENGMSLISEVKDPAAMFKETEKSVSGTNFDLSLTEAKDDNHVFRDIKLKEDITKSNTKASLSSFLNTKERVKFSDQIKKKVKDLKPLQ